MLLSIGAVIFIIYIYGGRVQVITDHSPLKTVLTKLLNTTSSRIQCLIIYIQKNNLIFKNRAGKEIPVAVALSRLHLPDADEHMHEEIKIFLQSFIKALPATDSKVEEKRQKDYHR